MLNRRSGGSGTALVVALLAWCAACVGADPDTDTSGIRGQVGGSCYANGTCNPGLLCTAEGRCIVTPGTDGGGTVGAGDASGTGDADVAAKPACNGAVDCVRVVFLTRSDFPGALSNLAGADEKCNTAATTPVPHPAVKDKTFVAWVSTPSGDANARHVHSTRPYVLPTGEVVATSWEALTGSAALAHAINVDEKGAAADGVAVWTGTFRNGSVTTAHCNNWFDAASNGKGTVGNSGAVDDRWTMADAQGAACNQPAHLYCIEY